MQAVFELTMRVYYEDTDAGGIVYHANYLKYFERARTEWLRELGSGLHEVAEQDRVLLVVKNALINYHAPARLDETIRVTVAIEKMGRASLMFAQAAWCDDRLLATGKIKVGCIAAGDFRPHPFPAHLHECMRSSMQPHS